MLCMWIYFFKYVYNPNSRTRKYKAHTSYKDGSESFKEKFSLQINVELVEKKHFQITLKRWKETTSQLAVPILANAFFQQNLKQRIWENNSSGQAQKNK